MIVKDNIIYSSPGYLLVKNYDNQIVGPEYWLGYIYYRDGKKLPEPHLETASDFREETPEEIMNRTSDRYVKRVEELIRQRYTISDEFALQRQRDTKQQAFQEYFDFCEECKKQAKKEMFNGWEDQINESNNEQ